MTESDVAAFVDGTMTTERKASAVAHLAACRGCRVELAEVQELVDTAPKAATAVDIAGHRFAKRSPWVAFAAVSAVAAALVILLMQPERFDDDARIPSQRNGATDQSIISLVSPPAASTWASAQLRFVWNARDGATYRITVTGADGATLWSTSTTDTTVLMPSTLVPPGGSTLHWFVDALLHDGQSMSSASRSVRIAPVP